MSWALWLTSKSSAQEERACGDKVNFQVESSFPQHIGLLQGALFPFWLMVPFCLEELVSDSRSAKPWVVVNGFYLLGAFPFTLQSVLRGTIKWLPHSHFSSSWAIASHLKHQWINSSHRPAMLIFKIGWDQNMTVYVPDRKWERAIFRPTLINHSCLDDSGRDGVSCHPDEPGNSGCELWCALVGADCRWLTH